MDQCDFILISRPTELHRLNHPSLVVASPFPAPSREMHHLGWICISSSRSSISFSCNETTLARTCIYHQCIGKSHTISQSHFGITPSHSTSKSHLQYHCKITLLFWAVTCIALFGISSKHLSSSCISFLVAACTSSGTQNIRIHHQLHHKSYLALKQSVSPIARHQVSF